MKTRIAKPPFTLHCRALGTAVAALGLTVLPSCIKEDDALQTQIIETRAAMEQRNKELEQTQAQLNDLKEKMQRMSGASAASDEIVKLKARNTELESQLAAARQQAANPDSPPKFDLDAVASKLEDDLTRKAKQLRELVQKQTPSGRVDEISLKAIEYPQQLLATFNSAITFNILADNGQRLRLMFPVTADLGGTWKLPAPAEVQAAYQQAKTQPQGLASNQQESSPAPAPAPASSGSAMGSIGGSIAHNSASNAPAPSAPAPAPAASQGGGTGMRQVDANTFMFNWGDAPARGAQPAATAQRPAPAPAPAPAASQPNMPIANFTPPGPGGAAPSAPPAPARGGPAAPASPAPAPVMPVQQDVTIRFD